MKAVTRLGLCLSFLAGGCAELLEELERAHRPTSPPDAAARDAPVAEPPPPPCESSQDVSEHILTPRCGVCHGPVQPEAQLVLTGNDVRERLRMGRSRSCQDRPFVVIDDGQVGGHLFDKIAGPVPGCGQQMPFGALPPLRDAEVACLRRWFLDGDRPDAGPALP